MKGTLRLTSEEEFLPSSQNLPYYFLLIGMEALDISKSADRESHLGTLTFNSLAYFLNA